MRDWCNVFDAWCVSGYVSGMCMCVCALQSKMCYSQQRETQDMHDHNCSWFICSQYIFIVTVWETIISLPGTWIKFHTCLLNADVYNREKKNTCCSQIWVQAQSSMTRKLLGSEFVTNRSCISIDLGDHKIGKKLFWELYSNHSELANWPQNRTFDDRT